METFNSDTPADCQSAAADSTTTAVPAASSEQSNVRAAQQCAEASQQQQVSSTTAVPTTTTTATAEGSGATAKSGSPPLAASNNNNNNNKIKSQQQQQQQQYHQFRAPQQFVRHRRAAAAATLTKKNKTWNKRQNKTAKQQQQQHNLASLAAAAAAGAGVLIVGGGAGSAGSGAGNLATTKADLENIQIFKNQLGGHHYYPHHGHRGGNGGGADGRTAGNGLPPASLAGLEKLGYGHGHLKQQLYKKMLAHRGGGHHHHVLCAGAAHNTLGGLGGGAGGAGGGNISCCLVNGCSGQNGKDAAGIVGGGGNISISSSAAQTLHYCCGRSKFFLPDKRLRKEIIIPPTKFLLGGNISDPLNLNSLQNETSNTSSNTTPATTPRQSPITTPPKVEVIIPPNIHDPLHLLDPVDSMEYEKQLTSPMKRGQRGAHKHSHHKHRHRKNRKPKRRRYESYNSVSSTGGGLELDEHSTSSLGNSTVSTDASTSLSISLLDSSNINNNNNNSTQCSSSSGANVSAASGALATASGAAPEFPHEEREESLPDASSAEERAERNRSPLLLSAAGGAANLSGELCSPLATMAAAATATVMAVAGLAVCAGGGDSLPRERASRDLRLELNSTTSSTCGSVMGGGGGGAATGRKRKISESNNSQKNKKFHRLDSMDKIVSPVVPQPGAWKRPPRLAASGSRKPSRRSTSISETEVLSPADELARPLTFEAEMSRVDTPDLNKLETNSEAGLGSPLSTTSGATSVAAGEQESLADTSAADNSTATTTVPGDDSSAALAPSLAAGVGVGVAVAAPAPAGAIVQLTKMPKFRADGVKYRYGNYDRYVGFRHLNEFMDVRLQVFQRHLELFQNKDILDIGCNVGHMTITVARNLAPKSILGIDIDKELIARARRNLSLYVRIPPEVVKKEEPPPTSAAKSTEPGASAESKASAGDASAGGAAAASRKPTKTRRKKRSARLQQQHQQQLQQHLRHHHHHLHYHQQQQKLHVPATELFPVSFPLTYGGVPCAPPSVGVDAHSPGGSTGTSSGTKPKNDFPRNVFFRQTNYVLKDESQLSNDTQQYDLILCLSVTKWIHLNFGDAGLKLAFKRMFNQLRPGGKLILEAQNWASYKKKKNLTEQIYHNYRNIEFFPNKFHEYLLSSEVGFSHSYTLGVPRHLNKGFCRPIQLYAKGDYTPNHVRWSDAYYPQTPYEAYRGIYATMPPRPAGLISYAMSSTRSQAYDTPHYTGGTSGPYSCRQTPMYQPTSQYYNPLETDSYLPSYDMEYLNHMYVFASPLYQTVWSPPASLRNSSSHTPVFGSVRDAELDGDGSGGGGGGSYHRHVYPPNDETSSPNANAGGAFSSIRDADTDDSNQLPAGHVQHVYATNCGESSSSPQVQHHDSETIDESLMLDEELPVGVAVGGASVSACCDLADKQHDDKEE